MREVIVVVVFVLFFFCDEDSQMLLRSAQLTRTRSTTGNELKKIVDPTENYQLIGQGENYQLIGPIGQGERIIS